MPNLDSHESTSLQLMNERESSTDDIDALAVKDLGGLRLEV